MKKIIALSVICLSLSAFGFGTPKQERKNQSSNQSSYKVQDHKRCVNDCVDYVDGSKQGDKAYKKCVNDCHTDLFGWNYSSKK
jgi:hypothetical protein